MIIYGYRGTQIYHGFLPGTCPACGSNNQLELYVFQNYAHIFWIPLFPIYKIKIVQCSHCHAVFKKKSVPEGMKAAIANEEGKWRAPWWTFIGLGLFLILIAFVFYSSGEKDKTNKQHLMQLNKNDLLEIKLSDTSYTLYKVDTLTADSVFVRMNFYETDKESGLMKMKEKGDSVFSDDLYGYSKTALKEMYDKGELLNIERE